MVFIADIPVACAAGMASRMESDFRGFFSTSALVYGFIGNGVAVVYAACPYTQKSLQYSCQGVMPIDSTGRATNALT